MSKAEERERERAEGGGGGRTFEIHRNDNNMPVLIRSPKKIEMIIINISKKAAIKIKEITIRKIRINNRTFLIFIIFTPIHLLTRITASIYFS